MKKHIETQNLFKKFDLISSVQSRDTHLLNVIGHWSCCFLILSFSSVETNINMHREFPLGKDLSPIQIIILAELETNITP